MRKKIGLLLVTMGCLMAPSCLLDTDGLLDLGADLLCEGATSGLPYSGHLDYCSIIDIDLNG